VKVLYGPAACGTADTILGDWLAADSQGAQAVAAAGWQCEDDLNLRLLLGGVARCWAPPATSATHRPEQLVSSVAGRKQPPASREVPARR
jgi:hypothetical protein